MHPANSDGSCPNPHLSRVKASNWTTNNWTLFMTKSWIIFEFNGFWTFYVRIFLYGGEQILPHHPCGHGACYYKHRVHKFWCESPVNASPLGSAVFSVYTLCMFSLCTLYMFSLCTLYMFSLLHPSVRWCVSVCNLCTPRYGVVCASVLLVCTRWGWCVPVCSLCAR